MVATDITEHVRLEEQRQQLFDREREARQEAEHLGRMKDEFIAVLSHELRTPLNVITGWTHLLQKHEGDDELKRGLAAIERSVQMQAQLVSDLTDVSRLNLGKVTLAFESLDPAQAVREVVDASRPSTDVSGIELEVGDRPRLAADSGRSVSVSADCLELAQ